MKVLVFSVAVFLAACTSPNAGTLTSTTPSAPSLIGGQCPITTPPPVALTPPPPAATGPNAGLVFRAGANEFLYGNDALVVGLPKDGTLHPSDPSRGLPGGMKFGWDRLAHGDLTISTRRLDAATAPVAADVPGGYGDTGFQVSGLSFPAPGCWQVRGTVDGRTLTFVLNVAAR